jgi:hypothetical protein
MMTLLDARLREGTLVPVNTATRNRVRWALPLVFAAVLFGLTLLFVNMGAPPIDAHIVPSSVEGGPGDYSAFVTWTTADGTTTMKKHIVLPDQYVDAEVVPIRLGFRGTARVVSRGLQWPPWEVAVVAAGIGAMLGFVVLFSAAGYGYIRGTGASGTTKRKAVREDRGFYWRS